MAEFEAHIHNLVRGKYASIAKGDAPGCASSCCGGPSPLATIMDQGKALDYTENDLHVAPGEANLGLGCGNPISRADLKPGEVVLDLGSGAGFDAFLAARQVGASGKVIGVDMTPDRRSTSHARTRGMGSSGPGTRLSRPNSGCFQPTFAR